MIDSCGRNIDYLRVSVTDRCNLRCVYCMPEEGIQWKPHGDILSFEEILSLCRVFASLGIRKIKVTGGEPLVRRGCAGFILNLKKIPGIEQVTLTTNGLLLDDYLDETGAALSGINISLDSRDRERFRKISGGGEPERIVAAARRAAALGIPVKFNCVPLRGINEADIVPLAGLARDNAFHVRFIELMPLGRGEELGRIPHGETVSAIEAAYGKLTPDDSVLGNGPAAYYSLAGFHGRIGFISALSGCFCETCNRLRLSSSGVLKPCLASEEGRDLKALLRSGAEASDLEKAVTDAVARKPGRHSFTGRQEGLFRIGG